MNDKFADNGDLVIPKNVSNVPEKIEAEIYNENRDGLPIKVSDCPHLNVSISIAVRVAITRRTAISELKEFIRYFLAILARANQTLELMCNDLFQSVLKFLQRI